VSATENIRGAVRRAVAPAQIVRYQMFVGGRWVDAESGATFQSVDPYTGEPWAEVPDAGEADVDRAVRAAHEALTEGPWGRMTGRERSRLMLRLAEILARDVEELAVCETRDNGKLLRETRAQAASLPDFYEYFAGAADKLQGDVIPTEKPNFLVYTRHEPVGVVAAIIPWNSPLHLLTYKLSAALAAGCTFVCKPSEQTPCSTLEFARRFEEAGFPKGVFNVVTGYGPTAGKALSTHPGVAKIAFTGSTRTGIEIVKAAADNLTRVSLELGGKSPNIVFPDADLDAARNGVMAGIFAATGQTCIAGSRLLVHESVHDDLVARLAERAATIRRGDPMDPETEMGPVAFRGHLRTVLGFVERAVADGATLVCGGGPDEELGGLFVQPTILTGVRNDMEIACEEVFGPVLAVLTFRDEDDAVRIANETRYGLAAGIWTNDVHRAHRVAHRLQAGTVWVNTYRTMSYASPFGGYKQSGWGRENGLESVREFTETKTIWVELSGATPDPFVIG
jgi:acyl-CoA reductase-like NAD-dependent aldehyde dehydrogenase